MKKLITLAMLFAALPLSAQSRNPINRGYLVSTLDANSNTITNLAGLQGPYVIPATNVANLPESSIINLVGDLSTLTGSIGGKVNKSGDTMTGELLLFGAPTTGSGAATKDYVDNHEWSAASITSGTLPSARLPAFSGGDVTSSSGSAVLTIANAAVTYAKLQNVSATKRLLGRNTSGAGSAEELQLTTVLDWLITPPDLEQGSVPIRGASSWRALPPGAVGYVLASGGALGDASWKSPSETLDLLGTTPGSIAVRGATSWQILPPGPEGYILLISNGVPYYSTNIASAIITNLTSTTVNATTIKVNGKAATVFSVNGTEMPISNLRDSATTAISTSGTNAEISVIGVTTTNLTWNTETLSPSSSTNFVLDLLSPRTALITATNDVNWLNSTNRTSSTGTERSKKVRILASGADRTVTLHSSWRLVGTTARTITVTNGTWLVMAADGAGPSETNVFVGAVYAQ
jgi:hypothetical protein